MADDLKYGYKGAEPTQSFGNNTGVFDPNDINNLIADNKWTTFGQLELIETLNVSGSSTAEFLNLQESTYDVHFVTFALNLGGGALVAQLSNDGGSSYLSSGYQRAAQYGSVGGTFGLDNTTSSSNIGDFGSASANNMKNGYLYFYSLGDNTNYSFSTYHAFNEHNSLTHYFAYGGAWRTTLEINNAIQFTTLGASTMTGTTSLYGIRYS